MPIYRLADLKLIALQIERVSYRKENIIKISILCNSILSWSV